MGNTLQGGGPYLGARERIGNTVVRIQNTNPPEAERLWTFLLDYSPWSIVYSPARGIRLRLIGGVGGGKGALPPYIQL